MRSDILTKEAEQKHEESYTEERERIEKSSSARIEANRANSLRSTGPRDTSSTRFNAMKHGLTAEKVVVTSLESMEEYEALVEGLRQDYDPQSSIEELLVQQIANCIWRRQRLVRLEKTDIEKNVILAPADFDRNENIERSRLLATMHPLSLKNEEELRASANYIDYLASTSKDRKKLHLERSLAPTIDSLWIRYDSTLERQFHRALDTLHKIQAARSSQQHIVKARERMSSVRSSKR